MAGCYLKTGEDQEKAAAAIYVPPELIYEILCRLPAKSVGRFRCVSKHWQTLLSDPKFLKTQFTHNNHQTKLILSQFYSFLSDPKFLETQFTHNNYQTKLILSQFYSFLSVDIRKNCNNSSDPLAVYETLKFEPNDIRYTIHGSCNGLLLLYKSNMELSIANPITRESRQLPALPQIVIRYSCIFGFGYCSKDDEYTVVVISDRTGNSPVFMLKGNLWKRVENCPLNIHSYHGAFLNGAINWIGSWDSNHPRIIYAFDLSEERFREVELPEGLKEEDFVVMTVLGGGGCLCLAVWDSNLAAEFWVMKEYGVRESWTKYVTYSPQAYMFVKPLFLWSGDESIVAEAKGRLVLLSLKEESTTFIPVVGERFFHPCDSTMWTFVDSLFSPNNRN